MRTIAVLFTCLCSYSIFAQQVSQEALERCADISDSLARLSCFEQLTDQGRSLENELVDADESRQTSASSAETTQSSTTPPSAPVQSATPVAEPQSQTAQAPAAAEIGSEQLQSNRAQEQENLLVVATVNEVTRDSRRYLYFHLDNGQVWRQIEARFVPYPRDRPFQVEIDQGMMGEYRLRVEGEGRMVRIRRIE